MAFVLKNLSFFNQRLCSRNLLTPSFRFFANKNVKKCSSTLEENLQPCSSAESTDRPENTMENVTGKPASTENNCSVGEYVMKLMKQLKADGKLNIRRRSLWLIRRHREIAEKFSEAPKQVLGLSLPEFKQRIEVLQSLKISLEDALVIALSYPSCLSFCCPTMLSMVALLNMYGCYLPKHFLKNPYVFSLDSNQCETNLQHLKEIGLTLESIGNLIDVNPMVLTVPVSKKAEEFAKQAENYQSRSNILRLALKTSLLKPGEQVVINKDFDQVVLFLNELKVDISELMQKCPEFLHTSYASLLETYQFLCGAPLYCEKNHVKKLLKSNPHAFLQMNKSSFQQIIQSLSQIIDSNMKLYMLLQKSPVLFVNNSSVLERIALLKHYRFSQKEIVGLLEKAPFIFCDQQPSINLEKKIHLFLSTNDITTSEVCKLPHILRAPLEKIQKRLFFIRCKKIDIFKLHTLNEIIFSNNHTFIIEMCGSTLTEYLSTVDVLDPI